MNKIIVGASSSGLYTGISLAQKGIKSIIFEKRENETPSKRTLIITPEVLNFLHIPENLILNRIKNFEIFSKNHKIAITLKEPDLVIQRSDLIKYLEKIAISKGISLLKGREFIKIFQDNKKPLAEFKLKGTDKKEYFEFDTIVGADGVQSRVANNFNINPKKVHLIQAKILLPEKFSSDTVKIWFDKRFTDYFIWLIPDSEKTGVCGLCADEENVKQKLNQFLKERNFEAIEYEKGFTSCYEPSFCPEIHFNGVKAFLIGDAGFQVKMTTVGGTFTGFWGAYVASRAISQNKRLKKLYKNLKREMDIHFYIRKVLSKMEDEEYDRLLLKVSKNLKSIFFCLPRDKARKFFFKMLLKEPYLLHLGMKKLLNRKDGG